MSQDPLAKLQEQLSTALSRIATMETELAPLRAQARSTPQGPTPQQIIQAMIQNPHALMKEYGVPKEYQQHMTAALVAAEMQEMGLPIDPGLATRVHTFPQTQKVDALANDVAALRQTLDDSAKTVRVSANRESLKTTSSDKSKYPYLAAAMAKNPTLFEGKVTAESDVAALAESLEKELAATADALGYKPQAQTASQEDAGNASTTTSTQVTAHTAGTMAGNPPPLPRANAASGFSEADADALKDKIARKYKAGAYDKPPA